MKGGWDVQVQVREHVHLRKGRVIVRGKVDHLMKLCDDFKANLQRAEDRASQLVEAVVQEMVVQVSSASKIKSARGHLD